MTRIAVIGAGMAGAACASALRDAGHDVLVLDKGRSVGGRMAQRRVDGFVYDHGAQYLSARDPEFVAAVSTWQAAGLVTQWPDVTSGAGDPVSIGVPAMNAPIKAMLAGVEVVTGARVVSLTREDRWWLGDDDGGRHGPFDKVAVTVPAPQAVELVDGVVAARTAERLRAVRFAPCWAALVTLERPMTSPPRSGRLQHDVLAWIGDNATKPGHGDTVSWTLHATPGWSQANLERPAVEVAVEIAAAFGVLHGEDVEEQHRVAHRWRYSMATAPLGEPCLVDGDLGFAGDWCFGLRVEAAWMSGTALARALG